MCFLSRGANTMKWLFLFLGSLSSLAATVNLTWSRSPDPNASSYNIYYGTESRVYTNAILAGNVTNLTISGLANGTTFYFAASASDSLGNESDLSNEAVLATPSVLVLTVSVYATSNLLSPWTNLAVLYLTNPPGNGFFRSSVSIGTQ